MLILVNFDAPGSGSGSAFPIRIRIKDNQINADPCGFGSTTLVRKFLKECLKFTTKIGIKSVISVFDCREGLCSCLGYLAIYLAGVSWGREILVFPFTFSR
jgi:hypothetical protein